MNTKTLARERPKEDVPAVASIHAAAFPRQLHSVEWATCNLAAWDSAVVQVAEGRDQLIEYWYPGKAMKRYACRSRGATLYNTNVYEWVVVSQSLLRGCHDNHLPEDLESDKHFFYEERVLAVDDLLPKYLRGVDGPLYDGS